MDPLERTLEAFPLRDGRWLVVGLFKDDDAAGVAPFEGLALNLTGLRAETEDA